jgi:hypothetical protein
MRTTFSFDDDKQLVQLARTYVDAGARIAWKDIARRMRPAVHSAAALRQRLQSLFRTWGRDIARFPASFFTEVRRPRGRPPAITQQIRIFAAHSPPGRSRQAGATTTPTTRPTEAPYHDLRQSTELPKPSSTRAASKMAAGQAPAVMAFSTRPAVEPPHEVQQVPASPDRVPEEEAPLVSAAKPVYAFRFRCPLQEEAAASVVREVSPLPKSRLANAGKPSESLPRTTTAEAGPAPAPPGNPMAGDKIDEGDTCETPVDIAEAQEL